MYPSKRFILILLLVCIAASAYSLNRKQFDFFQAAQIASAERQSSHMLDSMIRSHPMIDQKTVIYSISRKKLFRDKTGEFYSLLALVLMLGLVRLSDPRYFPTLWHTFKSPNLGARQYKDKIESATFQNMMMNVFFSLSLGAFLFYTIRYVRFRDVIALPLNTMLMLSAGVFLVYLIKYMVIRFSGWVFRVENITDNYIFNVFFINKILGVSLLPFTLVLAFAQPEWAQPALILAGIVILVLFAGRYVRSWQVFGSFFQYSKFHFFMYLCASELLPLAVLMKLLVRGLL